MSRFVPPPEIFSAVCIAAVDDPDVPPGVHLRLMPSPAIGFPLVPFGIYRITPEVIDLGEGDVLWRDREGNAVAPDLAAAGGVLQADIEPPGNDAVDVAVEVVGLVDGRVTLLDRVGNRVFCMRSKPPFLLGAPRVDRVRIAGDGGGISLRVWRIFPSSAFEQIIGGKPIDLLSLPLDGDRPWYAHGLGRDPALRRVEDAAPLRLAPPDQPDGPFDPLTRDDERTRILAHETSLIDACELMVDDPGTLPTRQRASSDLPAANGKPRQIVDVRVASALLAQAMDPGIGRYLGLVDFLDERPDPSEPTAYAAIGSFAIDSRAKLMDGRQVVSVIGQLDPLTQRVCEHFRDEIGGDVSDVVERHHLAERCLIAVAGAVPPPDPPRVRRPDLGDARWLDPVDGPSTTFRQEFLVPTSPLGSLIALGRLDDGTWETRHQTIDLPAPASPSTRALALLLGRTKEGPLLTPKGFVSDAPVTADGESTYRLALADLFGRFGRSLDVDVPDPARPAPPAPAPQANVVLDGPDGEGGGPASPGHVNVQIPVPSVSLLPAGSLDIASLELEVDGIALPPKALVTPAWGQIAMADVQMTLPPLAVGEQRRSKLRAVFVNSAGGRGPAAEVALAYADRRRPPVIPTAIGLIWTSRPGPSPEVELRLAWPGAAGTKYRAYVADAKSLGVEGASRAEIAAKGGQWDREHTLGGRERFRLLTDPPLEPSGGTVFLSERLPRSLSTVQFLRIVPATAGGREADFDTCGVVALAVPTDRRPPAPRVQGSVSGQKAKVSIDAIGLDLVELEASEPGLFTSPPDASARPPRFRLRRAAGAVSSPLYAREVTRGDLKAAAVDGQTVFRAEFEDENELEAFVRYSYWAEVQMPPERRLEPGMFEIPPAAGVLPAEPAQIADMPRPFSVASAPAMVMAAPTGPPAPLMGAAASVNAEAGNVQAVLTASDTPSAHPLAVAKFKLRIWEQWGGGDLELVSPDLELQGGVLEWTGAFRPEAGTPLPLVLHVAVIDPLGRESALVKLTAA